MGATGECGARKWLRGRAVRIHVQEEFYGRMEGWLCQKLFVAAEHSHCVYKVLAVSF